MASIIKRCGCGVWDDCPHPWIVRYRTQGGRSSRQREQSFGDDLREAGNFLLKVEHDEKARVFIDPKAGTATFRAEAGAWLAGRLGADSSDAALPARPCLGRLIFNQSIDYICRRPNRTRKRLGE